MTPLVSEDSKQPLMTHSQEWSQAQRNQVRVSEWESHQQGFSCVREEMGRALRPVQASITKPYLIPSWEMAEAPTWSSRWLLQPPEYGHVVPSVFCASALISQNTPQPQRKSTQTWVSLYSFPTTHRWASHPRWTLWLGSHTLLASRATAASPRLWIYRLLTRHMRAFFIIKDKTRDSLDFMPNYAVLKV